MHGLHVRKSGHVPTLIQSDQAPAWSSFNRKLPSLPDCSQIPLGAGLQAGKGPACAWFVVGTGPGVLSSPTCLREKGEASCTSEGVSKHFPNRKVFLKSGTQPLSKARVPFHTSLRWGCWRGRTDLTPPPWETLDKEPGGDSGGSHSHLVGAVLP